MQALILAGGRGERMKPLTNAIPKAMLPIRGKPFLEYQVDFLKEQGIKKVILSVGYQSEIIKRYFGGGKKLGLKIVYSQEKEPLGTGGAVKKAEDLIENNDFFVLNGDSFLEVDLNKMYSFHIEKSRLITIAAKAIENSDRYGRMVLEGNKVVKFEEKKGFKKKGFINGGVYVFQREVLKKIPKEKKISLEKDIFPKFEKHISAFKTDGYFIDIGTKEDYQRIQEDKKFYEAINQK